MRRNPVGRSGTRSATRLPGRAPQRATSARRAPFALVVGGLVLGALVTLLGLNTASAANEVQRSGLAAKDQSVAAQLVQLQNQAADSAAPENLARAAAALGMVPAGEPGFLQIGRNGLVTLLGKAAPASGMAVAPAETTPATASPTATSTATSTATPTTTPTGARTTTTVTVTATAQATPSPTHRAHRGRHHRRHARHRGAAAAASSSPSPAPSPTPTPQVILPGGNR